MKQYKMLFWLTILLITISTPVFAQWEGDQRLTNTAGNSFLAYNNAWNIAASGDTVHVVFTDDQTGAAQIYYTCSYNAGINWNAPIVLSQDTCNILSYTIAVSGSTVHVVWVNLWCRKLMYRRSTDAGVSWSQAVAVVNPGIQNVGDPCLAVSGNNVYLVYTHNPSSGYNVDLFFISSMNGGVTWSVPQRLTYDANGIIDGAPSIAVSGNILHLIWVRTRPSNLYRRVLYLRSTNSGVSWEPERFITSDTIHQTQPVIAVAGSNVHVTWMDQRNNQIQIFYRMSSDNGANWQPENYLTEISYTADYQTICAIGNNIHVAWRDFRTIPWHIGYRNSTNNGLTWQSDIILTPNSFTQEGPSIAAAGSKVHLIWYDDRNGNWEIYYKRNPTGSGIEEQTIENYKLKIDNFSVYPNPAKTYFTIRLPQTLNQVQGDKCVVKIFNVTGKIVKDEKLKGSKDEEFRISLDGIKNGVYFIQAGDELIREKLVITK